MGFRLGKVCQCHLRGSILHRHMEEDVVTLSSAQSREENAGSVEVLQALLCLFCLLSAFS